MSINLLIIGFVMLGIGFVAYKIYQAGKTAQTSEDLTNVVKIKDKQDAIQSRPDASPDDLLNRMRNDK